MKFENEEQAAAHRSASIQGGARGLLYGVGIAVPLHFLLARRAAYRAIPLSLKALGYTVLVVPIMSVTSEKAGEAYSRSLWTGVGMTEIQLQKMREEQRIQKLDTADRIKDWAKRNKWGLIAGGWAGSMALAFGIVARTPQTFAQKIVQARMWAQGLTVGTLLSSAVLAGATSESKMAPARVDHSWADILQSEGQLKPEDRKAIRDLIKGEMDKRAQ